MSHAEHEACNRSSRHMLHASTGLLPHTGMRASKPSHRYSRDSTASQPNSVIPAVAACSSGVAFVNDPKEEPKEQHLLWPGRNTVGTNQLWNINKAEGMLRGASRTAIVAFEQITFLFSGMSTSTVEDAMELAVNVRAAAEKAGGCRLLRPCRIISVPPSGQACRMMLRICKDAGCATMHKSCAA